MKPEDYDKTFFWNRNDLLYRAARDTRITPRTLRVIVLFATFVSPGDREMLSPSYEWIMKTIGIGNRRTLSDCLKQAQKFGYLRVIRKQRMPSTYMMPFDGLEVWKPKSSPKNLEVALTATVDNWS